MAAPPELAHALYALEATPALNTSVVFRGLLANLLAEDSLSLLETILNLPLASLTNSDMQQVKVCSNESFMLESATGVTKVHV